MAAYCVMCDEELTDIDAAKECNECRSNVLTFVAEVRGPQVSDRMFYSEVQLDAMKDDADRDESNSDELEEED